MKKTLYNYILLIFVCALLISCGSADSGNGKDEVSQTMQTDIPETAVFSEVDGIENETATESGGESPPLETSVETGVPETDITESITAETTAPEEGILGYTAPEGWYAPRYETGKVEGGDYNLEYDVMGLKVYYVQKAMGVYPNGYYRSPVLDKVAYFQSLNGLDAEGIVDLKTWLLLGLDENDWYTLGAYVTPVGITKRSTREEIISVFLNTAKQYIGTPFVVGASGKPGQGVDCSGLVLQCLYAIGIYPDGLDPVQHSTVEEYNSRLMWADEKFKKIKQGDLLPGDLVFYTRPGSGSVCHVAIYLGDDECIEALHSVVEILPLYKDDDGYAVKGFKRVISE